MNLSGKTAIITGAAQGIGYAIARRFLRDGARVVVSDINDERGQQATEDLQALGDVSYIHADVGRRLDVHNLIASTMNQFGEIDILVNNAGIVLGGNLFDITEEEFDQVMRVNLKGAFLCAQAAAQHMVKRVEEDGPAGCIINMSSINAKLALPEQIPYTVSKGAVRQLTNVLAQSLAPWGIRVNAIGPGSIATEMLDAVNHDAKARHKVLSRTPLGRVGEPEEIAGVAAFLASSDASYITGQTLYADGGRLGLAYTVEVKPED